MDNEASRIGGTCLCGAVRFAFEAATRDVGVCHCAMCRRWAAGPFLALEHVGAIAVEGSENVSVYKSSEWGERAFCKICGTSLYWRMSGTDHFAVSAGALDDQEGLALTTEIFIDEKPSYYAFANETKTMTGAEVVAAFAGGKAQG